jgi:putative intracellular protease/amidase
MHIPGLYPFPPSHWRSARLMPRLRGASAALVLILAAAFATPVLAADKGEVLVILSSANQLQLRDGKTYHTGFYLDELAIPLRKMIAAGYTPVFANPDGKPATFDPVSNDKIFFGGDDKARADAVKLVESLPAFQHPKTLTAVLKEGTAQYVGIFIPGGHAPMQDLSHDKTLGQILVTFHQSNRPTGLICHGPTALLSAIPDTTDFHKAMVNGDTTLAGKLASGWPYAGYRVTVFSTAEEQAIEGEGHQLGGHVQFYAADALAQAGAHVDRVGLWGVNVIEDREVVSGQQPFSSDALGDAFVAKLNSQKSAR